MAFRGSLTDPGSDEEIDDEIGETLEVDPSVVDEAFQRAITKGGTSYLDKLELVVMNDSELENEVNDIIESFSFLKSFIGDGGEHANKLSLTDLEDFGITSERVRHRIGLLAFLMGNRSPSASNRHRRESSLSGVQSQASGSGEYEDDFEAIDDADESPRVRLRKMQREKNIPMSGNSNSLESSYKSGGEEDTNPFTNILSRSKADDAATARSERKASFGSNKDIISGGANIEDENEEYTVEYDDDDDGDDDVDLDGDAGTAVWQEREHRDDVLATRQLPNRAPSAPQRHGRGDKDWDRDVGAERGRVGQSVDYYSGRSAERNSSNSNGNSNSGNGDGGNGITGKHRVQEDERRASTAGAPLAGDRHNRRRSRTKVAGWIRDRKWTVGEKIGSGSFGEVFQGMNDMGRLFAVKQLHIAGQRNVVDELANEIQLMRDYAHPNIVGYLGADVDESKGVVNIFQEWVPGGSLAHLLKRFGAFNEHVVANYTRQIVSGLAFLHANGIIHRDIKGGNVLVDESGSVKLADFGASTKVNPAFDKTQETSSFKGTPYFMAPEVLGHGKYGRKGDIWAVGCTMIQMLTGQPPWKDRHLTGLVQLHILLSDWDGPPVYPTDKVSPECQECIRRCFAKDETSRPTAKQLLLFPFLVGDHDSLEDSGRIVESFERRRLRSKGGQGTAQDTEGTTGDGGGGDSDSGGDEVNRDRDSSGIGDGVSSSPDPLEDSGIAQMANLRAQIARLAQSTDSLPGLPDVGGGEEEGGARGHGGGGGGGGGGGRYVSPRDDDSVEAVQRQLERRRMVKKAVDMSRRKARGEGEADAEISPISSDNGTDGTGGDGLGTNPAAGIRINTARPSGPGHATPTRLLAVRDPSEVDSPMGDASASASESSSSLGARRSNNPYARGAGTQKIGAGANRTPRGVLGSPPLSAGVGAGKLPMPMPMPMTAPPATAPARQQSQSQSQSQSQAKAKAKTQGQGERVDTRMVRSGSAVVRRHGAAESESGAGARAGAGAGDISTARDSEGLTPGEEPPSPFVGYTDPPDNIITPTPEITPVYDADGNKIWTCLACGHGNTEPSYCVHCSVVRGATGRKGVSASVVRR